MNYTTLIADKTTAGSIKAWMNKTDVPSETVLAESEQWLYQRLQVREMRAVATGSLAAGECSITLPARFRTHSMLRLTSPVAVTIDLVLPEALEELRSYDGAGTLETGIPTKFALIGEAAQLPVLADDTYTYRWLHYAALAPLAADNETNFLTDRAPQLLRYACLMTANEWAKDDKEKLFWMQKAEAEVQRLNEAADAAQFGAEFRVLIV